MALYIPQSILHLARSLYVRPETYGPTYVEIYVFVTVWNWIQNINIGICIRFHLRKTAKSVPPLSSLGVSCVNVTPL